MDAPKNVNEAAVTAPAAVARACERAARLCHAALKCLAHAGPAGRSAPASPRAETRYPAMPVRAFHDITVLTSNWAMVMGPTPPGTGVMAEAMQLMSSYLQSPTSPSSVR